MKYSDLRRAYLALIKISAAQLDARVSFGIYTLLGKLGPTFEKILSEEARLLEENGGELLEDGSVFFKARGEDDEAKLEAQERMTHFREAMNELNNTESDVEIDKIAIGIDALKDVKLSATDIASLDKVFAFNGVSA